VYLNRESKFGEAVLIDELILSMVKERMIELAEEKKKEIENYKLSYVKKEILAGNLEYIEKAMSQWNWGKKDHPVTGIHTLQGHCIDAKFDVLNMRDLHIQHINDLLEQNLKLSNTDLMFMKYINERFPEKFHELSVKAKAAFIEAFEDAGIGKKSIEKVCMHESCKACKGTGMNLSTRKFCVHYISCNCPKCNPEY
jgi:hypothetical protein